MRLRPIGERYVPLLRLLWSMCFLMSVAAVALGTVHAVRETYQIRPVFRSLGLDYDLEPNGRITLKAQAHPGSKYRLRAIDGRPVAADIRIAPLARQLAAAADPAVALSVIDENGVSSTLEPRRGTAPPNSSATRTRDLRFGARIASGVMACGALLLCSLLLARRRPSDPVALLFAFAFAGLAAIIDPPIAMWMAYGWPPAYDVASAAWFYLQLIALAIFPDGIFVPKPFRWLLLLGVPLAIFVSVPNVNSDVQALVAIGSLLLVVGAQVLRYRRLEPGIERQQIKWAAFGFTAGLLLVACAFILLSQIPEDVTRQNLFLNLIVVLLFSLGMATLPLGLLIALTRFRLWEADTVITRSAAYAVVTLFVGVVWAVTSDLLKMVIEEVIGRESQAGATTAGAIIAAGIFSPTQSLVLG
jgi:MFS family permease